MAAMNDEREMAAQVAMMLLILTVERVPLIGIQARGNLRDGEKIVLVYLPLQARLLQANII